MCCSTICFTVDTSAVRTQYFVVERTKPCVECGTSSVERDSAQPFISTSQ
jgi:hypothetical protein